MACFVLLFDVIRDSLMPEVESNFYSVEAGVECFLHVDNLLLTVTQAILRVLKLTREIAARTRCGHCPTPPALPFSVQRW